MTRPNAARTAERLANMRSLIAELHNGDMLRHQIETFLGMCQSGARSYTDQMRKHGIIEVANKKSSSRREHPVYHLIAGEDKIAQFLVLVGQGECRQGVSRDQSVLLARDPSRHIHVMQDDAPFRVKMFRATPRHTALHAAFWGAVG